MVLGGFTPFAHISLMSLGHEARAVCEQTGKCDRFWQQMVAFLPSSLNNRADIRVGGRQIPLLNKIVEKAALAKLSTKFRIPHLKTKFLLYEVWMLLQRKSPPFSFFLYKHVSPLALRMRSIPRPLSPLRAHLSPSTDPVL